MNQHQSAEAVTNSRTPRGDTAAAIDAGQQMVAPVEINPQKLYRTSAPGTIIDGEPYLYQPRRTHGCYTVATVESFIDIADRFFLTPSSTIWLDIQNTPHSIAAVFNDNADGEPGWGDMRAILNLEFTEEWNHWVNSDGKMFAQEEFAEHIEDGIPELVDPDAATMLEIAQSIQATVNTNFRSSKRLADGEVGLVYEELIEGKAGQKGELTIPQTFKLAIAPFLGEDVCEVKARLRYRIPGGNLRIGYHLERPENVVLDALEAIKSRLDEKYPSSVFMGSPAPAR